MSRRVRIKVSLFAFQDIITSVTGVIVLVTLLSSLELVHRKAEPVPSSQAAADVSRLADQIPALELANQTLRQQLEDLRAVARAAARASPQTVADLQAQRDRLRSQAEALGEWRSHAAPEVQRRMQAAGKQYAELEAQLAALEAQLARTRQTAARAAAGQHRLYRFRPSGAQTWWIGDLAAQRWRFLEVDRQGAPTGRKQEFVQSSSRARLAACRQWLADRSRQAEAVFLLVRPSTIKEFDPLRGWLREQGFRLGFDLLAEDQTFDMTQP